MYQLRTKGGKRDLVKNWALPDKVFFASGACHILAYAFLKTYPASGFAPVWIRPANGYTGNNVLVVREPLVVPASAEQTHCSAQNVAVSDFMRAPTLAEIDLSRYTGRAGQCIRVVAEEGKLGAAKVRVSIADRMKMVVEEGPATMDTDQCRGSAR